MSGVDKFTFEDIELSDYLHECWLDDNKQFVMSGFHVGAVLHLVNKNPDEFTLTFEVLWAVKGEGR